MLYRYMQTNSFNSGQFILLQTTGGVAAGKEFAWEEGGEGQEISRGRGIEGGKKGRRRRKREGRKGMRREKESSKNEEEEG